MSDVERRADVAGQPQEQKEKTLAEVLLNALYLIFSIVALVLLAGIASVGVIHIGLGLYEFWRMPSESAAAGYAIEHVLKGLEFLFLSPLPFMIVYSVGRYLGSLLDFAQETKRRSLLGEIVSVKALIISLIIAIIATDLVSKILAADGLTRDAALYECLVILVLGAYLVVLERHS